MKDKSKSKNIIQWYRELWYLVADQPPWSQPIWKTLLVIIPVFVLFDVVLVLYVVIILIMKMNGATPPNFW
ncbi:MAG: hypothetical protein HQ562_06870 [Candidatus Marinimicrobia bacterium]|nr:hypothetical protein [Candidatus Neomarinimicrobiota bacterium]